MNRRKNRRRATSLPIHVEPRYPRATDHGLTGNKKVMYALAQHEVTDEIIKMAPLTVAPLPRNYGGHQFGRPLVNTGKRRPSEMGVWSQIVSPL
jgi:hypothetical protein